MAEHGTGSVRGRSRTSGEGLVEEIPTDHDLEVAQMFAEMARRLSDPANGADLLAAICSLAIGVVGGCEHSSVSLASGRKVVTAAASDPVSRRIDQMQYDCGEGPCLEAIKTHAVYRVEDLRAEPRWPVFARRAVEETAVRSMLSFRLYRNAQALGSLNLSSESPGGIGPEDEEIGAIFAAHVAVAVGGLQDRSNYDQAIASRQVIGQAVGILMARQGIRSEAAFDVLRRASQRTNVKLRDVAERIAESGATP